MTTEPPWYNWPVVIHGATNLQVPARGQIKRRNAQRCRESNPPNPLSNPNNATALLCMFLYQGSGQSPVVRGLWACVTLLRTCESRKCRRRTIYKCIANGVTTQTYVSETPSDGGFGRLLYLIFPIANGVTQRRFWHYTPLAQTSRRTGFLGL